MVKSGTYIAKFYRKMASGKKVAGSIRFLANARSLQLECVRVLH